MATHLGIVNYPVHATHGRPTWEGEPVRVLPVFAEPRLLLEAGPRSTPFVTMESILVCDRPGVPQDYWKYQCLEMTGMQVRQRGECQNGRGVSERVGVHSCVHHGPCSSFTLEAVRPEH
jgi:hypothetical protein